MKISQFSIFFCMWQVHPNTFWDLTTWKCVTLMNTYIYVKLRHIAAQEVQFLEFNIKNFRKVLWQTQLFTFSTWSTYNLPSFYCFGMGLSLSRCWVFVFIKLTLLLLFLNVVKLLHQKKWMPLKMSAFRTE